MKRHKDRSLALWLALSLVCLRSATCSFGRNDNSLNYSDNALKTDHPNPNWHSSGGKLLHFDTFKYRSLEPQDNSLHFLANDDTREEYVIKVAVLMPQNQSNAYDGGNSCFLNSVLPVIELALSRVQASLNRHLQSVNPAFYFNFQLMYGDTKCSSTHGPLIAFDMVSSNKPGLINK